VDPRVGLLKAFYAGLPKDRAKIETLEHGFAFLETLLSDGATLEYGELTLSGLLHKYKLSHVPEPRMNALLHAHVEKRCNVCLYFDETANSTLCFNLDNNHKTNNTVLIPEMEFAVRSIREQLTALGCEPLVIASGRGYHVWCRLEAAADNARLYDFMLLVAARTMAALHHDGRDYQQIKFNVYPDCRTRNVVSLRLFGSDHAKNKVFSRILTSERLLDERESWTWFERYLCDRVIPLARFNEAYAALGAPGDAQAPPSG
jgi:hypothetical protein